MLSPQEILQDALAVANIAQRYGATKADRQDIVDTATRLRDLLSRGLPAKDDGTAYTDGELHAMAVGLELKIDAELARDKS